MNYDEALPARSLAGKVLCRLEDTMKSINHYEGGHDEKRQSLQREHDEEFQSLRRILAESCSGGHYCYVRFHPVESLREPGGRRGLRRRTTGARRVTVAANV